MIIEVSSWIRIMQFLFKSQVYWRVNAWKACFLGSTCSGTGGSLTPLKLTRKHLQMSTDNKKLIYCYKRLAFNDGTSFKRSKNPVIGVLNGESTVYDIVHHFGCSKQTSFHTLMNRYNRTGSVKSLYRTWSRTCDNATSLSRYMLT